MDFQLDNIIGESKAIHDVLQLVKKVANTQATVLISGESGTGKELIALALHALSDRREKLFLPVNCGALPETLLESLVFGHIKGSFTGAFANQEGLFEKAKGGTIFLDEIGEIPQHLQVKLLRALEAKEILPLGSTTPRRIDVRVLAATNRNLNNEVEAGRFREDLYYRLNVMEIHIPPLRERPEDIPALIEHFIKRHNPELKRDFQGMEEAAVREETASRDIERRNKIGIQVRCRGPQPAGDRDRPSSRYRHRSQPDRRAHDEVRDRRRH